MIKLFQTRVREWTVGTFGHAVADDIQERGDRLLEETLELLQSHGYDLKGRVPKLTTYVDNRPAGEPAQEVGGVMVTLAAYCNAANVDMQMAGDVELARCWENQAKIRVKAAGKRDICGPLPGCDHSWSSRGIRPPFEFCRRCGIERVSHT